MATRKQEYRRSLDQIVKRYTALEENTIRRMLNALREYRHEVNAELTELSDFELFRREELTRNLDALTAELDRKLQTVNRDAVPEIYLNGKQSVVVPLGAAGINGLVIGPSAAQVNILLDYSADLIRGISAEALKVVNQQIRLGALGQKSVVEVMREISKLLGFKGRQIIGGVTARAETVVRTEMQRVFTSAAHSQALEAVEEVPDMLHRWISTADSRTRETHLAAHRRYALKPIPVKEPFIVGGEALRYPLDPNGSAANVIR